MTDEEGLSGKPNWSRMQKPCKRGHLGWRMVNGHCVECLRPQRSAMKKTATYKAKDSDYRRLPHRRIAGKFYTLKHKYGISSDEYERIFEYQNGACAVCFWKQTEDEILRLDHDHGTGKIRGLLCHQCNVSIGLMKDSAAILRNAAEYVELHRGY